MKAMHVINVFLAWWGSFFMMAVGRIFMKGNKLNLITLALLSALVAALMTPLFLTVTDDPDEAPPIEGPP